MLTPTHCACQLCFGLERTTSGSISAAVAPSAGLRTATCTTLGLRGEVNPQAVSTQSIHEVSRDL